ncbi:hypothetical protein GGI43DRAFT_428667 [Trichoderma evansii]
MPFIYCRLSALPANLASPHITIYKRDSNVVPARREGYSLSIAGFDETGRLFAARDLGILDDVMKHATQGLGNQFPASGLPTAGNRIARKNLRKVLTDAVGPEQIQWNTACVDAQRLPSGKMRVKLSGNHLPANESTVECDLLIIADGAASKIRGCLRPDDVLQYAGVMQMGGLAVFPNGIPKPVDKKWGILLSSGKGVACFLSPYDEKSVAWGLSHRAPTIEEPVKINGLEDANNHAVSPFSGYGVSLALKDVWDLATQLCSSQTLEEAVKAYDAISMLRASKVLKESHQRIDMGHATGFNYILNRSLVSFGGFILGIKDALTSS